LTYESHLYSVNVTAYWLTFYVPLNTNWVISETFSKPSFWLGMEKQNLTQQSTHSAIKRNVLQHKINTNK